MRTLPPCYRVLLADICFVVYGVFFLETAQTALTGTSLYYWFADNFGNSKHVEFVYTSFYFYIDALIMAPVASLSVQLFFVYRIYGILVLGAKRSRWLCAIICLVICPQKSQNDLIIPPVGLHCRRTRRIWIRCLCEPPPPYITLGLSIAAVMPCESIYSKSEY